MFRLWKTFQTISFVVGTHAIAHGRISVSVLDLSKGIQTSQWISPTHERSYWREGRFILNRFSYRCCCGTFRRPRFPADHFVAVMSDRRNEFAAKRSSTKCDRRRNRPLWLSLTQNFTSITAVPVFDLRKVFHTARKSQYSHAYPYRRKGKKKSHRMIVTLNFMNISAVSM